LHTDLAHILTPSLSGQRAVRRSVLKDLDMDSVGFGIECALTELWETEAIRVKTVILRGVTHRTKEEKRGYWKASDRGHACSPTSSATKPVDSDAG
jgi:hypothetical protein